MSTLAPALPAVFYPSSDGERMADNTLQFEWIVTLQGNLDLLFRDDPEVFVAGDHLIYPIEGDNKTRFAPDAYVAFGRPKGHRGSYVVFAEANIFPQVIFEVWSPSNEPEKMEVKRLQYQRYGAEEYYILYPDFPAFWRGWLRENETLVPVAQMNGFISPRLGVRFEITPGQVAIYHPNGDRFLSYLEQGVQAEEEAERADAEHLRADSERTLKDAERVRADAEHDRAARFATRLRELGIDPDTV